MMEAGITKKSALDFVRSAGADICGIAGFEGAESFIRETYGDFFAAFPRAVSFALYFPKEVVQEQLEGPTRNYITVYTTINREIDRISTALAVKLQKAGFRAYPVAASDYRPSVPVKGLHQAVSSGNAAALPKIDLEFVGAFGHRVAAARAGLGWIGKSCCLVNPDVGPRLRLGTVLTDAPFEPDQPMENRCGDCVKCVEICPPRALSGRAFSPSEPLSARLDLMKCHDFMDIDVKDVYGVGTCGLCLAACPWGI